MAMSPVNIGITTWLQQKIPSDYRGRVFGLLGSVNQFLSPLAMVTAGWILERQTVTLVATLLGGIGILVSILGVLVVRPHMSPDKDANTKIHA